MDHQTAKLLRRKELVPKKGLDLPNFDNSFSLNKIAIVTETVPVGREELKSTVERGINASVVVNRARVGTGLIDNIALVANIILIRYIG